MHAFLRGFSLLTKFVMFIKFGDIREDAERIKLLRMEEGISDVCLC